MPLTAEQKIEIANDRRQATEAISGVNQHVTQLFNQRQSDVAEALRGSD